MMVRLEQFRVRLHVIGVVKNDPAAFQRADVVSVAVVVKAEQQVGLIAGAEHFAGADAHLEDGGAAGNGGRNGHESHDLLLAAAGKAGEKAADGLDAILGIARDADDGFRRR